MFHIDEERVLFVLKQMAWLCVAALCWLYAARGHSTLWPKWDLWFWGIAFWIDLAILGIAVMRLGIK